MELKFRKLKADEIDCRVQKVYPNGLTLLLYKDARCDQNILDETVGAMNWQRHHNRDNANCIVSIWDSEKNQWVEKEDTGKESRSEKEKGLASDSFKRACFNWGIGRELYTAPFIWIQAKYCNIKDDKCNDRFEVRNIGYTGDRITELVIYNTKTKEFCYRLGNPSIEQSEPEEPSISNERIKPHEARVIKRMLEESESDIDSFLGYYHVDTVENMTEADYVDASRKLNKKLEGMKR